MTPEEAPVPGFGEADVDDECGLELSIDEGVAERYPDDGALAKDVVALLEEHADDGTDVIALAGQLESVAGSLQAALDVPDDVVLRARFPDVREELQEARAGAPPDEEVPR